jgi:hypothetical protein
MSKKILQMNLADFMLSGKFGENYSKTLCQYFNTYFDYTTYEITDNGIVTIVSINAVYENQIVPVSFIFTKNYYVQNEITLTITCLYQSIFQDDLVFQYKNFVEFDEIFEKQLIDDEELQKLYII